ARPGSNYPRRGTPPLRSGRLLAAALCVVVAGTACSNGKKPFSELPADDLTPTIPATTTTSASSASPLTGALVSPAVARRPAVIVKVDNAPDARPQAGLNDADVIYEERVEGSVVRFLAIFQSKEAAVVGPVRSVRSTDAPIVAPIGGVFAFSGGIAPFRNKVDATGIKTVPESDNPKVGNYKRAGHVRPYATYANTAKLRALVPNAVAPPQLFPRIRPGTSFGEANLGAEVATGLRVVFGQLTTADWTWDRVKKQWLRTTNGTQHLLEDKSRLSSGCVILQSVPYRATQYTDRSDFVVDEAVITGTGKALVACDGAVVKARWSKPTQKSVTTFVNNATGGPITLPVGRVWVSLVPTSGEITVKSPTASTTTIGKQ
ncbi:MAG TPA: DUF3048 domain-containing protein, partial [Acidimicrobiales bacterium]|nr:DUF3048 domain-containing protein [Acidimicrobiales bacterium]